MTQEKGTAVTDDTPYWVLVLDTPSIKQFVFGTDALAEIRGASAILDELNQVDTERCLKEALSCFGGRVEGVYANGGSGQFLIRDCEPGQIQQAVGDLARIYRERTGDAVGLAAGFALCKSAKDYRQAVQTAHFRLRSQRELAGGHRAIELLPFIQECESASHLPASSTVIWGQEAHQLSTASHLKRQSSLRSRRSGVWSRWMEWLATSGSWPAEERWNGLRSDDFMRIGQVSTRPGYVGLVYADGNAMGKLVQELDAPDTFRAFSEIVDSSIRTACFQALDVVLPSEIAETRKRASEETRPNRLPADILMLGGDDLMVLLPADRALRFASEIAERFERLTHEAIARETSHVRQFFEERLRGRGLTVSCGVAVSRANYPFYLLLDLAEQLLRSAKDAGWNARPPGQSYVTPAFIDFHIVSGAASHNLKYLRREDYQAGSSSMRTLRPYSSQQLRDLRRGVAALRQASFPRSKLHDLFEAALDCVESRAERRVREIFSRCRDSEQKSERWSLWQAVANLAAAPHTCQFPWVAYDGRRATPIADLVEAYDLFPTEETP